MGVRTPKWESQLWTLVNTSDGTHCPREGYCPTKKRGGWCSGDFNQVRDFFADDVIDHSLYSTVRPEGPTRGTVCHLLDRLADRFLSDGDVHDPPVPTDLIGYLRTDRPIEVRAIPLIANHSAVWRLQDQWVVYLNSRDTPKTNRYALFHEAFHILARSEGTPLFRKSNTPQDSFKEGLADYFSLSVLMPRKWVQERWPDTQDVDGTAELFEVTKSTAFIRLRQLGLV